MNLLELRFLPIEGWKDSFKVSVEGASGQVDYQPGLPFVDGETTDIQDRGFTVVKVLESTKFNQDNFSEAEEAWMVREGLLLSDKSAFTSQYLAKIGRKLYQILGQNIQQVIEAAVGEAKRDRTFLHIRLRFPSDAPKYIRLTDYPWELLHNDYGFLAHQGVTFSRYIAYQSPCPNLPSVDLLNILLISSGIGDKNMGLESLPPLERKAIASGLQKAEAEGKIKLEFLNPPTLDGLRQITGKLPHVIHFDGHGFFGKRCNEMGCRKAYKQSQTRCECGATLGEAQGYLVFQKSARKADYVSAREIGELLGNLQRGEQVNSGEGIALVVLSSCRSGMSRLSESVFNGVAQNLIGKGIPAVVAMTYSISVSAASTFSEYFYRSLGEKNSLAVALRRGQSAMGIEGNQWYRPVLYLRWEDNEGGQLFKEAAIPSNRGVSDISIMSVGAKPLGGNSSGEPNVLYPNASPFQDSQINHNPSVNPPENKPPSTILMLNNEQKKKLREALISAFPTEADLEMMLEDELEIPLNTIAGGKDYTKIVRNVVNWFDSQGRSQYLIQAGCRANPGNPKLKEFSQFNNR